MYLHIGDKLLVKKKEIIAILDARKMNEVGKYKNFLKPFKNTPKSLVILVPSLQRHLKNKRKRRNKNKRAEHIILVSSISPATLKERVARSSSPIPGQIIYPTDQKWGKLWKINKPTTVQIKFRFLRDWSLFENDRDCILEAPAAGDFTIWCMKPLTTA